MKKIFAIIALFALVFTSCQKDETMFIGSGLDTITATIESTNGTKATLDGSYNVVWSEDDEISVFVEVGESVYNVLYTLSSVNSNGTGVFTKTSDHDISGGTIKAAFYPYTENARYENGTITGVYTVVQGTYSTTPTAARMAAKVESGTNISFKNIGAIVKVTTPTISTTYSAVQLYSATSYLSGDCSVSFEDDGTPVATPSATGSQKFVTFIETNTDEAQSGTTQSFYFPIFAGNYSDLTVVAKGGQSFDQELVLIAPKSLTAERSKLYYTSASVKTVTTGVVTLSKVQGSEEQNIEIATEDDQISVATEGSEPVSGKVNISINTNEEKELTITLPDATVLLSGKTTYSSITASTAENTLILGNGVTVGKVIVNKGNVQVNKGAVLNGIELGTDVTSATIIDNGGDININQLPEGIKKMSAAEFALINAISKASDNQTITLSSNILLTNALTITKDVTIDLNGYTIENKSANNTTLLGNVADECIVFYVDGANAKLTLNATNGGKVKATGNGTTSFYNTALWVTNGAEATINGGEYTNTADPEGDGCDLIYGRDGGKIYVNGGTFTPGAKRQTLGANIGGIWAALNCKDSKGSKITVSGGKFYKFGALQAENVGKGEVILLDANSYWSAEDSDGYYTVSDKIETEEALRLAISNTTNVRLGGNILLTNALTITKDVTIDLNGYTIENKSANNTTLLGNVADECIVFYVDGANAKLTLNATNGGKVKATGNGTTSFYNTALWVTNGAEATINGGEYTNTADPEGDGCDLIYGRDGGKIYVNGGTFTPGAKRQTLGPNIGGIWAALNCKDSKGSKITVSGGKFYEFGAIQAKNVGEGEVILLSTGYKWSEKDSDNYYSVIPVE